MATKVFSGRADADRLQYADSLAREQYGMSYGSYCSTVLLDSVVRSGRLPDRLPERSDSRKRAAEFIKGFSRYCTDPAVGQMGDAQIKELIAGRYA